MRSLLALCAIAEGRLADAESELERIDAIDDSDAAFGGIVSARSAGPSSRSRAMTRVRAGPLPGGAPPTWAPCDCRGSTPTGLEPWSCSPSRRRWRRTRHHARARGKRPAAAPCSPPAASGRCGCSNPADPHLDYPVAGVALFALGRLGPPARRRGRATTRSSCSSSRSGSPTTARSRRWRGSGSSRAPRRRARRDRRGARPPRRPAAARAARRGARARRARSPADVQGGLVAAHAAGRRSPSRSGRRAASSRLAGDRAVVGEVARRGDQVRHRVDVHERLQQAGSVSAGTNAFDMNVSGNRIIIEMPCTRGRCGRSCRPTRRSSDRPAAEDREQRSRPSTPSTPPPGR